ncbi:MAG: T9SS type A sorting domain-containing protein [Flavobacteriales bacterium]
MKNTIQILCFSFLTQIALGQGSFAPSAGQTGSTAMHKDSSSFVAWIDRCTVRRGLQQINDTSLGFANVGDSSDAFGKADGTTVSLGDAGEAIVELSQPVFNGPGYDFAVFENGFSATFLELAFVEVSSNGIDFFRFPSTSQTQVVSQVVTFGNLFATEIHNLAGKYHVNYGTPFDLDEIPDTGLLNKFAITHIKIIDVIGKINESFSTFDSSGKAINDPWPTPFGSSGFDLDAVGLIHVNGINSVKQEKLVLSIFPNPAHDFLTIESNLPISQVQFIDLTGRVFDYQNHRKIDISGLNSGVYFVRITTNSQSYVTKLVKK